MATYILLVNYTEQGVRRIKESPKRLTAARAMAREFGAELRDFYLTLGGTYDIVAMVEAAEDQAAQQFVLKLESLGNVKITVLKAFSEDQYRRMIEAFS